MKKLPTGWIPTTYKQNAGTKANPIRHHFVTGSRISRCQRAKRDGLPITTRDDSPYNCTRCQILKEKA